MIIDCVFPHTILENCIESIANGNAVPDKLFLVEDSFSPQEQCRRLAEHYNVGYIKSTAPRWQENNFALPYFWDCDYLIISHSDMDFTGHPDWYLELEDAWLNADPNVVALNMSVDAHRYYDLNQCAYFWRQIPGNQKYGVAVDMHVMGRPLPEARRRLARLSPVSSFKIDFLKDSYPLDVDFDCELFLKMTLAKKWSLWLNNKPLIHLMGEHGGADTDIMIREIHAGNYTNDEYFAPLYRVQSEFKTKYGIELYDYLYHDFGENRCNIVDDIIHCANTKTLSTLDPLLEQIGQDILNRSVPSYEKFYA